MAEYYKEILTEKEIFRNMFGEGPYTNYVRCQSQKQIIEIADSRLLISFCKEQTGIMEDKGESSVSFARIGVA